MTAQTVLTGMILSFSSEEIRAKRFTPERLTLQQTLDLIRSACIIPDEKIPISPEIQVFSSSHGILIFLRELHTQATKPMLSFSIFS